MKSKTLPFLFLLAFNLSYSQQFNYKKIWGEWRLAEQKINGVFAQLSKCDKETKLNLTDKDDYINCGYIEYKMGESCDTPSRMSNFYRVQIGNNGKYEFQILESSGGFFNVMESYQIATLTEYDLVLFRDNTYIYYKKLR